MWLDRLQLQMAYRSQTRTVNYDDIAGFGRLVGIGERLRSVRTHYVNVRLPLARLVGRERARLCRLNLEALRNRKLVVV